MEKDDKTLDVCRDLMKKGLKPQDIEIRFVINESGEHTLKIVEKHAAKHTN